MAHEDPRPVDKRRSKLIVHERATPPFRAKGMLAGTTCDGIECAWCIDALGVVWEGEDYDVRTTLERLLSDQREQRSAIDECIVALEKAQKMLP
jgi:hypothetical protein